MCPSIPSSQGRAPPSPEWLGLSAVRYLSAWVGESLRLGCEVEGGHVRGYHLCVFTKWSVLLAPLFWWFSVGRCSYCGEGPTLTERFSGNDELQSQPFIYKTPPHPILHSECLHAMFCVCSSVPPLLLSSHTETHFSPHACLDFLCALLQAIPTFTLCHFVVQCGMVMSQARPRFP